MYGLHGSTITLFLLSPMNPPFPPAIDLVLLSLTEVLFGFTYDRAVSWFERKNGKLFKFLVSWSVVLGTVGTLTIRLLFFWGRVSAEWQTFLIDLLCFAGSGLPMIIGSMSRAGKPTHKVRRWPTFANQVREDVVSGMRSTADELSREAKAGRVNAGTLVEIVHKLHEWVGSLKSV